MLWARGGSTAGEWQGRCRAKAKTDSVSDTIAHMENPHTVLCLQQSHQRCPMRPGFQTMASRPTPNPRLSLSSPELDQGQIFRSRAHLHGCTDGTMGATAGLVPQMGWHIGQWDPRRHCRCSHLVCQLARRHQTQRPASQTRSAALALGGSWVLGG